MLDTPGVYVQEIPSGSAPIAGVASSNTAFIGVFGRGPVGRATRITSWGEFERVFGGLHAGCESSYALRNYFLNGGNIAFVVRVNNGATAATALVPPGGGGMVVTAASPGHWADSLRIGIARDAANTATEFSLLIREYRGTEVIREESFSGLSAVATHPRYVRRVLAAESQLLTVTTHTSGNMPDATQVGGNGVLTLEALRQLGPAALTPLNGGNDGTLPGDTDAWQALAGTALGAGINTMAMIVPDVFNLMCLPDVSVMGQARADAAAAIYQQANTFCERNFAFLIVDPLADTNRNNINAWVGALGGLRRNAAIYYPRLVAPDPLNTAVMRNFAPSGAVAGIFARTDGARGVWKAPAGTAATVSGGRPVDVMTDPQQGPLNVAGINVIRTFPVYNTVVWGARTMEGADALASEWKYIPVRRLALHIENSLQRGLQWVVFEPNDEPLWASIRLNVTGFMSQLHRQGAFQGASARDAFLVKCDRETTTQADINLGILNIYVGFAPVRPAEFVMLRIQQRLQTTN